jgi:phosphoribosylformimino-5-aminoimidazole carboxamide ribonucleotide (ProFAR) isomerase
VAFEVLPAIDVAHGRLVAVSGGEVRELDAFGGSPLAAAEAFVAAGAAWLHVVDVDRADGGEPDLALLSELARLGARIQASGGIASAAAAAEALEAGAARVVLSSSVLADPELSRDIVDRLGARAVVGVEADGDRIRPRGVPSRSRDLPLAETLAWVAELGPARYLYTAVARVATMTGPDLDGVRAASALLGRPVLVAGGVRRIEDVRAVQALGPDVAEGCVVGRALYRGLDLVALLSGTASPAAAPDGDP